MTGLFSPGSVGSGAEEATGDVAFLQALLDAEAALTRAQAAVGLAPPEAAAAVTEAASDAARFDARSLALRAREGGNPVIPLVADLTAAVPADAAPYVHRGATSQDILDTALMLLSARTLDLLLTDLTRTEHALARLASRHRDTTMPGRTLTQHAVPTTFGLKAAGWRSLVLDARDRVARVRGALPVQLGGAAGTLAVFGVYGVYGGEGRLHPDVEAGLPPAGRRREGQLPGEASGAVAEGRGDGPASEATAEGRGDGPASGAAGGPDAGRGPSGSPSDGPASEATAEGRGDGPASGAAGGPDAGRGPSGSPSDGPASGAAGGPDAGRGAGGSPRGGASGSGRVSASRGGGLVEGLSGVFACELGLAEPLIPWHSLRTPVADLASALAFTAGALGKAAADVLTLSRTEIAELSEGSGGGSSAMPHKANPVRATLIAAAARRAPALAATLYGSLVAEDERSAGAWHAEWEPLRDLLRLAGGAARDAAEMAEGLRVHTEAMREHLDLTGGLIVSERLAAELTPLLGRARAKQLLTDAARRTRTEGRPLTEVLAESLLVEPALKGVDLTELTDPTHYTGSAGTLTDRALERR
ncbi:lyase family protein [Streptomyces sp. NPDC003032]